MTRARRGPDQITIPIDRETRADVSDLWVQGLRPDFDVVENPPDSEDSEEWDQPTVNLRQWGLAPVVKCDPEATRAKTKTLTQEQIANLQQQCKGALP